jgi:cytochrome c
MRMILRNASVAAAFLMSIAGPALADGNADEGSKVFIQCKACHSLEAGKNAIGPSLHALFGRTAGTAAGYSYSDAMKKAGAGGVVWNEDTLSKYLVDPKAFVPGDKMPFLGVKDPAKLADLIAYLKQATQ